MQQQSKAKQSKAKQSKAKQCSSKAKQSKAKQSRAKQSKAEQSKAKLSIHIARGPSAPLEMPLAPRASGIPREANGLREEDV